VQRMLLEGKKKRNENKIKEKGPAGLELVDDNYGDKSQIEA